MFVVLNSITVSSGTTEGHDSESTRRFDSVDFLSSVSQRIVKVIPFVVVGFKDIPQIVVFFESGRVLCGWI